MHASVVLPCRVDFVIFDCYLKGYDVGETVDFLVQRNALKRSAKVPSSSLSPTSQTPLRDDVDDVENSTFGPLQLTIPSSSGSLGMNMETSSLKNVSNVLLGDDAKSRLTGGYDASSFRKELLHEQVEEDYRNFRNLVHGDNCLRTPYAFLTTHCVLLPYADRLKMVNMYYDYEPVVLRLFIGHKCARSWVDTMMQELKNASSRISHGGSSEFLQKLRWEVSQIDERVVRRQLENFKRVCSTITAMYHRKGEQFIPKEVPLQVAVEKCFGLQRPLSLHYAVAVFSYEHNLTTRLLERFKTCEDCFSACNLLAAYGCDDSGLFVGDSQSIHLKAVGRQLEDTRLLGDLHMELFGEPFKPRWQQQLDGGMQRVIGSGSVVAIPEKVVPGTATAGMIDLSGSTIGSSPSGFGSTMSGSPPESMVNNNLIPGGAAHNVGTTLPQTGGGMGEGSNCGSPNGLPGLASLSSFPWHSTTGALPLSSKCANSRFTKRFCLAFGLLMKALSKIAFLLSSGHLNEALDCFATRVLHLLEQLSARDTPAPDVGSGGVGASVMGSASPHGVALPFSTSSGASGGEEGDQGGSKLERLPSRKHSESFLLRGSDRASSPLKEKVLTGKGSGGDNGGGGGMDLPISLPSFLLGGETKAENQLNTSPLLCTSCTGTTGKGFTTGNTSAKEKIYVLELCAFLGMLPQVWNQVTPSYDPDEREAFLSVVQLLKSLTSLIISLETV